MATLTYPITGMTCQKCVARVEAALMPLANTARVTLNPPQAVLTNPKADLTALNAAVQKSGDYRLLAQGETVARKSWLATYYPLLLILGYITTVSYAGTGWTLDFPKEFWETFMMNFMAGFFLVFSFFKLLDLKGFATTYASYDLLAARSRAYALAYPFIELALGLAYLFKIAPQAVNLFTFILMVFSGIGVVRVLLKRQVIRCACLGTALNLPMSTVTIVEDFSMAAMALWMLLSMG